MLRKIGRVNSLKIISHIRKRELFFLKCNSHFQDEKGWSSLIHSMHLGETNIFKELLKNNKYLNLQDDHGMTPFMHAVKIKKKYADLLQKYGADTHMIYDKNGHNGVHYMKIAAGFKDSPKRGHANE